MTDITDRQTEGRQRQKESSGERERERERERARESERERERELLYLGGDITSACLLTGTTPYELGAVCVVSILRIRALNTVTNEIIEVDKADE